MINIRPSSAMPTRSRAEHSACTAEHRARPSNSTWIRSACGQHECSPLTCRCCRYSYEISVVFSRAVFSAGIVSSTPFVRQPPPTTLQRNPDAPVNFSRTRPVAGCLRVHPPTIYHERHLGEKGLTHLVYHLVALSPCRRDSHAHKKMGF
jgi:hypothetical protein